MRPVWAEIDLAAVRHNVGILRQRPSADGLCAVVKADAYGHGAVPVARAAVDAGATWLAVALVEEAVELRRAGIGGRVLLLSEPVVEAFPMVVHHHLTPVVTSPTGTAAAAAAVAAAGAEPLPVHLKVNTGMNRVGVEPSDAVELAARIVATPELRLEGVMTHLAVADEPGHPFTAEQLRRFDEVLARLGAEGIEPDVVHAANSGGAILHPRSRRDVVRCGIAVYGLPPAPGTADGLDLRPVMRLRAEVASTRAVDAGIGVSYGLRHTTSRPTVLATVPIGYADGVPRHLSSVGGEVLIGGRRRPMVGVVTMDQVVVDVGPADGPGGEVRPGDEVVLLGEQGGEVIGAGDWAEALGTISYEIVCGLGPRVPRRYHDAGS